jgi:hypothetical protein
MYQVQYWSRRTKIRDCFGIRIRIRMIRLSILRSYCTYRSAGDFGILADEPPKKSKTPMCKAFDLVLELELELYCLCTVNDKAGISHAKSSVLESVALHTIIGIGIVIVAYVLFDLEFVYVL